MGVSKVGGATAMRLHQSELPPIEHPCEFNRQFFSSTATGLKNAGQEVFLSYILGN